MQWSPSTLPTFRSFFALCGSAARIMGPTANWFRCSRGLSTPKLRRRLFSEDDWNYFEALPRRITIYRGAKWFCLRGRSWTLDRAIAEKFTDWMRYDRAMPAEYRAATVMERTVSKDSVLFYTMSGASRRSFLRGRRRAEWRQKKPSACAQPKWRTSKTGE